MCTSHSRDANPLIRSIFLCTKVGLIRRRLLYYIVQVGILLLVKIYCIQIHQFKVLYILLLSFQLKESSAVSVENLEKCIQCGRTLKLPVSHCFPVPNENTEDLGLIWDNSLPVSPQEYHCQVYNVNQLK